MTSVSNVSSAVTGLAPAAPLVGLPGKPLAQHVAAINAASVAVANPESDLAKATAKAPNVPASKRASEGSVKKQILTVADAIEAVIMGDATLPVALASFGEAVKISGNREKVMATLRDIADRPFVYLPEKTPAEVFKKLMRSIDGTDASEVSRTITAVTAGSVLVWYVRHLRDTLATQDGGISSLARVTKLLASPCAKVRESMSKPVPAGWNGADGDVDVAGILAKAREQEAKARASTNARRDAGSAAMSQAAGRVTTPATPAPVPSPAAAQASVPNLAAKIDAALGTPATPAPTSPAPTSPAEPDWSRALTGASNALNGLLTKCPNGALAAVKPEMAKVLAGLVAIRAACEAAIKAETDKPVLTGQLIKGKGK